MPNEAIQIYQKLVKDHGMPECPTLMNMGHMWYETPEEVDGGAGDPVSTAVFRPLQDAQAAAKMAAYASEWLKKKVPPENEPEPPAADPAARLQQIIRQV
ncbi:MAG: hypothetical protein KDB82_09540 [Planctomycetes bacterium]|nr:hypothetical protein [Planctomycetota bacterium]